MIIRKSPSHLFLDFSQQFATACESVEKGEFFEIFVNTLAEARKCDVKGFYAKARRGEIKNFIGISSAYEIPENPELALDTAKFSAEQAAETIVDYLVKQKCLNKA